MTLYENEEWVPKKIANMPAIEHKCEDVCSCQYGLVILWRCSSCGKKVPKGLKISAKMLELN